MKRADEFDKAEHDLRAFADARVAPFAGQIDREERIPAQVVRSLAGAGVFASGLPEALGGPAGSEQEPAAAAVRHGLLHEALGAASASVQGLANVHHMAASAVARWGTRGQKQEWVPRLAAGEMVAAIAITEPNVGSDASAVETAAEPAGGGYVLRGTKRWITCGQVADVFVLLARTAEGLAAFLLPRETPGLAVEPIKGILGCRGYMLATLHLDGCRVSGEHLLGRPRFGLTHIVATSLEAGRLNLAWGCVGLARACLEAAFDYSARRRQFGSYLSEFQLVQRMIARMMTDVHAARLMCRRASELRARRDPAAIKEVTMAKYFASTMVNRVANDALQIHGANGFGPEYPLERFLRDARVMEMIEGSTQILEMAIARYGYQERGGGAAA
jgi:glutaryl-CoA dehydrogenase (non-decarboxylating)